MTEEQRGDMRRSIKLGLAAAVLLSAILLVGYVHAQSGIDVTLETYTKSIFGWKTTSIKTKAHVIFANPCEFDTQVGYASHKAYSAWWCFTCYAKITNFYRKVTKTMVGEDTWWKQGSWNAGWTGINHVWVYSACYAGPYKIHEKVYYDVNSSVNKVVDAIKNAIRFIVEVYSKIVNP